jgi:hypothetical protein
MDGTARDIDELIDVSNLVNSFLLVKIVRNEDSEQTLELYTVATYSNSSDSTSDSYTRRALSNGAGWGEWESRN